MMLYTLNSNIWEVEAGGLEAWGQPELHSQLEASLYKALSGNKWTIVITKHVETERSWCCEWEGLVSIRNVCMQALKKMWHFFKRFW